MAVVKRQTMIYTLDEAQELLRQPANQEELIRRRAALKDSDRFLREMAPIAGVDVKDWIRKERGESPA